MDQRSVTAEFLRTRRERITPERAGIVGGGRRRVPGLRREEVALLAGVSTDYYARMERGDLTGVSAEVLAGLAHALQLDEAESAHLHDLARAAGPQPLRRRSRVSEQTVRVTLQRFLDAVTGTPVWVRDRRLTFVAGNPLGRAVISPILDEPAYRSNTARFMFLNPAADEFFPDWERDADNIVATMRTYAGQNPHDKLLTDLIGELVTRSDAFRVRWAAHNVRFHHTGIKRMRHPQVGELEFVYEPLSFPDNPDWLMFALVAAEPGGPTEERVKLLGSLAASAAQKNPHHDIALDGDH